ncbi:MAG: glycosyltransferase [Solirubrobacteraceae bacterium]|nr:MAG: glycosyltransferase family 4 protein [Solirubrobacterales bacterium]
MRVCVVAEYYPRRHDPVRGIWAHEQARAVADAGADVRVLALHRPIPPRSSLASPGAAVTGLRDALDQPRRARMDSLEVRYVRFLAPPRPRTYAHWGAWAAPTLSRALRALRREFPYDLVHAHYAVPAGDAVRRAAPEAPLVISVHGGDVLATAPSGPAGRGAVRRVFEHARLVLANSADTARRSAALGASATRVVHLGTDLPAAPAPSPSHPTLVTVANLDPRKRHADVLSALWLLRDRHPDLRYVIVGDGPEREPLARRAAELGLGARVELRGQLAPAAARAAAREASLFVLPSVGEAFGVAYIEAMAGWVPAIGCVGEGGPQEIAAAGDGLRLVAPGDAEALAGEIDTLLGDPRYLNELGRAARATVERSFTWEHCGAATMAAYEDALR